MAHSFSPHSPLASPPRYEKSSINQRNNCLGYDQRDPAPRYSSKTPSPYQAEADLNGPLGLNITSADDKLPPYAPTLQLLTLCRRKNELVAKDRKAKKRSWGLVWLLLDGTALRMYQPTTSETKQFEKEWNEKYCRKGPVKSVVAPVEREEDEEAETDEEVEVEDVLDVHFNLIEETRATNQPSHGRGRSSSTAKTPFEPIPTPSTSPSSSTSRPVPPRIRTSFAMPSLNPPSTSPSPLTLPTLPVLNLPPHPSLPTIPSRKPTISHAVRNISCTRATTYFKRHFVLRFILEDGKQFLVQLNSHEETLVWQQIMTIAAPLALDIDERDMPEPAPYPRLRRRTLAPVPSSSSSTTTPISAPAPTLVRRPSTAPGVIDSTLVPNVPPEYETSSPARASVTHADGGMRRRRSFSGL